jgi:WD40 repeat protein
MWSYCPNIYTVTTGRVQSFKFPLTLPGEWLEYKIHGDIITQMKLSLDDNRLITASKDGSLCFWQVRLFNLTFFFL